MPIRQSQIKAPPGEPTNTPIQDNVCLGYDDGDDDLDDMLPRSREGQVMMSESGARMLQTWPTCIQANGPFRSRIHG